jgi:hypothetical protein
MNPPLELQTADAELTLQLLRDAGERGIGVSELRERHVAMPAQALYEVELAGWLLERRGGNVRLRPEGEAPKPRPELRPKVRRVTRSEQ